MKKIAAIFLIALTFFLAVPVVIAALAFAVMGGGGTDDCAPTGGGTVADGGGAGDIGPIPGKFVPLYQGAAARFDLGDKGPSMLAGIHFHETSFSTNIATSGPYVGPMAHGTAFWDTYGVDGNGDGKKDIMNNADAIYAAAKVLKSFNAKSNWRDALASYNAGPANKAAGYGYADDVMAHAEEHHVPATGGGAVTGGDDCESAGGGTVSGDVQSLAQQLLDHKNVSFPLDAISPNGSTESVLKALAQGKKAPITYLGGTTTVNPGILKFALEYAELGPVGINAITDKKHSGGSPHYSGQAIDFECNGVPFDTAKADPIAKKYGGKRNSENCSVHNHWHYDFPK